MTNTIRISAFTVQEFAKTWPCSGLDDAGGFTVWTDENGDLNDIQFDSPTDERRHREGTIDGAAVSALIDDCRNEIWDDITGGHI